jgi:hypothetical protein
VEFVDVQPAQAEVHEKDLASERRRVNTGKNKKFAGEVYAREIRGWSVVC